MWKAKKSPKVFLFGFSRGALVARHFAAWLDKLGVVVAYLGLWDTVDSTIGLDVAAVVLHDPHGESSNLWGAFDRVRRKLTGLRLHFRCRGL